MIRTSRCFFRRDILSAARHTAKFVQSDNFQRSHSCPRIQSRKHSNLIRKVISRNHTYQLFGDTIWNIFKGRNHLYQLKIKSFYHLVQTSNSQNYPFKDMDLLFGLDHPDYLVKMKEDECYLFFSHIRFIIDMHQQLIKWHYHLN